MNLHLLLDFAFFRSSIYIALLVFYSFRVPVVSVNIAIRMTQLTKISNYTTDYHHNKGGHTSTI